MQLVTIFHHPLHQQHYGIKHALMTDAVTKNLKIENNIATALGTTCKPMHLLCKSHTVEALDRSNLSVLYDIEKQVQQREILEGINPSLK